MLSIEVLEDRLAPAGDALAGYFWGLLLRPRPAAPPVVLAAPAPRRPVPAPVVLTRPRPVDQPPGHLRRSADGGADWLLAAARAVGLAPIAAETEREAVADWLFSEDDYDG